jgi:hypothetical protein
MSSGSYNYAIDAVARSNNQNMFATAKADNLETAIVVPAVNLDVSSGVFTSIPAAVFANGSGVYHLWCNGPGSYDVCSTGSVTITPAGTIASSAGFTSQVIQSVTAPGGAGACAIVSVSLTTGGGAPGILQNSGATQTYNCQAIKIAN